MADATQPGAAAQQLARLRAAAAAMPVLDRDAASRAAAGNQLQIDAALAGAGPGSGIRQAQALAPTVTAAEGTAANQAAAQSATNQLAVGQLANQAETQNDRAAIAAQTTAQQEAQVKSEAAARVANAGAAAAQTKALTQAELEQAQRLQTAGLDVDDRVSFLTQKQRADLANLGRDVKAELFDSRLQFDKDEAGRKFSNDRQLWDYTVATAKSEDELKDKAQAMQQASARRAELVQRAYVVATADLDRQLKQAEQEKDQTSKAKILDMKRAMEAAKAKSDRDAANKSTMVNSGITVLQTALPLLAAL